MTHRSFGKISPFLLPMVIAVPFVLEPLPHSLAEDDLEVRRTDCRSYAQKTVEQVKRYNDLKCTDKEDSARWNPDEGAHFSWCFLLTDSDAAEAGFGSREMMIAKAGGDREAFLATCKKGDQDTTPADASTEEVEFKCPERIGNAQFRPDQIKKYFTPPKEGSDLGAAVCDFYLDGGGQIRLEGQWLANYVELPASTQEQLGCDKTGGSYKETSSGMHVTSDDRHAGAHMTGDTKTAVDLILQDYSPLQRMFNFAHLRARPCR